MRVPRGNHLLHASLICLGVGCTSVVAFFCLVAFPPPLPLTEPFSLQSQIREVGALSL